MDWMQFITFFVGMGALMRWSYTRSEKDNKELKKEMDDSKQAMVNQMEANARENRQLISAIHMQMQQSIDAIQQEIKDFHARLYGLERVRETKKKG